MYVRLPLFNKNILRQLCQEALNFTRAEVKFSTNLEQQCNALEHDVKLSLDNEFNNMRLESVSAEEYSLDWVHDIARIAKTYQLGNCCEKTCVAYDFLYQKFSNLLGETLPALELYNDPFSDHFFLVIGRNAETDSTNPLEWNKDTIICDPWAEEQVYSLGEVDFNAIDLSEFQAISNLYNIPDHQGSCVLKMEILASAVDADAEDRQTLTIPVFVCRNRLEFNPVVDFKIMNASIPMTIESWDLPENKFDFSP
jgi:hypothetical protein